MPGPVKIDSQQVTSPSTSVRRGTSASSSAVSAELTDYSQVDILDIRYSVQIRRFQAENLTKLVTLNQTGEETVFLTRMLPVHASKKVDVRL